ncbi:MAG: hypothetical protein IT583_03430 [Verrucomicrobia bacterium]|nr:hypothetical protein [Verrucomicrobiota bacterium]
MNLFKHWKFWAVCVLAASSWAQKDINMEISGFRVPEYDEQGVMTSQLFGDRAEVEGGGEVKITGLRVEFYKEGKTVVTVTSPYCFYNQKTREAHSDAPVAADMDRMTMRGRGFLLKSSENTVQVFDNSRVVIKDAVKMSGEVKVSAATNTETVITSKELFIDYKARKARFEKNVHVQDAKMEMYCDKLDIQLGQGNQIDWIGASTGVRILHEGREALAGKATYEIKSDEFLLEEHPRIVDGKNMLMGERIRFWRGSGRMVCEPSARMVVYSDQKMATNIFGK